MAQKDAKAAKSLLNEAFAAWDKAAKTGVVHWRAASRKKSRLSSRVGGLQTLPAGRRKIFHMPIVAPSLLASDFLRLEEECNMLNESTADWFHLDVMDGQFVPNISYGPMIIEFMRKTTKKPFDVHLMIVEPEKYAEEFKKAGADHVTVHLEACPNLHRNIQQIKSLGMKAGVAINPHSPVNLLAD